MADPVAVPVEINLTEVNRETRQRTHDSEDVILDEGLDHNTYKGTYGSPFLADYLGIRDLYKTDPTGNVVEMVDSITNHILEEVEDPMIYSLKDLLQRMEGEMNIQDNDAGLYRLKQLNKLIEIKTRLRRLEEMKMQAIEDIDEMI